MGVSLETAFAHFAGRDTHEVEVPEWGGTVYFKTPNSATLSKVNRESKGDPIESAARLVAECALNEGMERLFKSLDYKDLMIRTDPSVVSRIASAIMAESHLDVASAEKN